MRRFLLLLACSFVLVPGAADAQDTAEDLAQWVRDTKDGRIRFTFETREGVWGDGHSVIVRGDHHDEDWDWESECTQGPAHVQIRVRDGEVWSLRTRVGGKWRALREGERDLGAIDPAVAAEFFLELATTIDRDDADDAIFAATMAKGFDDWERLLEFARDDDLPRDVREAAVFWLGQAASERVAGDLEKLVEDDDADLKVREHAVFAISQREEDEALPVLMRVARSNPHPQLREKALFWMAQIDDPRVVDLFEEILLER
jgi:hypothetical protein